MPVTVVRRVSSLALRAGFFTALFLFVVATQVGLTTGLRAIGIGGGLALLASGLAVIAVVLGALRLVNFIRARRKAGYEAERAELGLPEGPLCVVWRGGEGVDMPWEFAQQVRVAYPPVARHFGIEGVALVDFEIGADGRAKLINCVDVWPSNIFFRAAAAALKEARFKPRRGATPRFGASYQLPFVFRLHVASGRRDRAVQARRDDPMGRMIGRALTRL